MNVCIFYYDGFCEFETVFAASNFKKENLFSAALENRVYVSEEHQRFLPDKTIEELNADDIDLFIIPGGDPSPLYSSDLLRNLITGLDKKGKYIGGICGGTFMMAKFGVLDGKRCTGASTGLEEGKDYMDLFGKSHIVNEDVVVDGNAITSTGQAFIEFSLELGKIMHIYKDEEEAQADYKWIKNIK